MSLYKKILGLFVLLVCAFIVYQVSSYNAPVNGVCGTTKFSCFSGLSTNNQENPNSPNATWKCEPEYGGTVTANCSAVKSSYTAIGTCNQPTTLLSVTGGLTTEKPFHTTQEVSVSDAKCATGYVEGDFENAPCGNKQGVCTIYGSDMYPNCNFKCSAPYVNGDVKNYSCDTGCFDENPPNGSRCSPDLNAGAIIKSDMPVWYRSWTNCSLPVSPTGSISLEKNSCTITSGTTCSIGLVNWSVNNPKSGGVTQVVKIQDGAETVISTANSGSVSQTIPEGNTLYILKHDGSTLSGPLSAAATKATLSKSLSISPETTSVKFGSSTNILSKSVTVTATNFSNPDAITAYAPDIFGISDIVAFYPNPVLSNSTYWTKSVSNGVTTYTTTPAGNLKIEILNSNHAQRTGGTISLSVAGEDKSDSGSMAVSVDAPLPDLTASSVTPTSATINLAKTFEATISNSGGSTASATTHVFQYDSDTDHNSVDSYQFVIASSIDAGASRTISNSHTFTSVGTYYMRVCADLNTSFSSAVPESNEDNNCGGWTEITINPQSKSDLTAGSVSPNSATKGIAQTFTSYIYNSDNGNTTGTIGHLLEIMDSNYNSIYETATTNSTISSSSPVSVSFSHTFANVGTYQLRICADNNSLFEGAVDESNENNNCSSFSTVVVGPPPVTPLPDLTVGTVSPNIATVNIPQTFTVTVSNSGNKDVTSTFANILQIDMGGTYDYKTFTYSSGVAMGASKNTSSTYTFSTAGSYPVRVCVDNDQSFAGNVAETNENNNCGGWSTVVVSTPINNTIPTVSTSSVSSITQTSAISGGTIVSDGGAAVTVSGIVWGTSVNPTTSNSKTTDGWATGGPWTSSMNSLSPNTTYHIRAYATNSEGTAYGSDVSFTTSDTSNTMTGAISAPTSCQISANSSSCNVSIFWSTTNPIATSSLTSSYPSANTVIGSTNNGSATVAIPHNSRDFYLYNNGVSLSTVTVSSSCVSGSAWNGNICYSNATPSPTTWITATPSVITLGGASTISWSSINATSCTGVNFNTNGAISGDAVVHPTVTTVYSMSCVGVGGQATDQTTVTVTVQVKKPGYKEN